MPLISGRILNNGMSKLHYIVLHVEGLAFSVSKVVVEVEGYGCVHFCVHFFSRFSFLFTPGTPVELVYHFYEEEPVVIKGTVVRDTSRNHMIVDLDYETWEKANARL